MRLSRECFDRSEFEAEGFGLPVGDHESDRYDSTRVEPGGVANGAAAKSRSDVKTTVPAPVASRRPDAEVENLHVSGGEHSTS